MKKFEGNIDNNFLRLFFLIRQNTGGVFDTLYQYMKMDRRQNIDTFLFFSMNIEYRKNLFEPEPEKSHGIISKD